MFVIAVFLDLSVAFDSVEVKHILPKKLKHYGANDTTVNFFRSFFNDRKHIIYWNEAESEVNELFEYSVCQGSSLGPPCFNKYLKCYKNVSKDDDDFLIG